MKAAGLIGLAGVVMAALASCAAAPSPPRSLPNASPSTRLAARLDPSPAGSTALGVGIAAGPGVADLGITRDTAARALVAFRASCPALGRRTDTSGLTRPGDWATVCADAASASDAVAFFIDNFETVRVGSGAAFATGYYEPEIAGSRTRDADHQVAIYAMPDDLREIDLGAFSAALTGKVVRGRVEGAGFVPYFDRAAIEDGAIAAHARVLAWAADPVEFFFLQVQGSGRVKLTDGAILRIGYAGQNGRDYTGIGGLMRDRGLVVPGQLSMQGLMTWLRANPDAGRAIMRENKSWVFFRELTSAPVGALGVTVTARTTVAADPAFVPLGAPVWLDLDRAEADGLWVAQDTGGAIKGANRVDTYWGAGDAARRIAGGMSGRGNAVILLPRGSLARLTGNRAKPTGIDAQPGEVAGAGSDGARPQR